MELGVKDLTVARGGVAVLHGVSFTLAAGRALILRAPNGAGKTTLLRTLAGLQPAWGGTISAPPEALAYGAHSDGLKGTLSVFENLSFWAEVHGLGLGDVQKAMARMNLDRLARRPAAQLSAGQKRRLGLARLLVTGRPIWLLDEPTVSLDQASVTLFGDIVRAHLAQGGIAVIASHIDLGLPEVEILALAPYRVGADFILAGQNGDGFAADDGAEDFA